MYFIFLIFVILVCTQIIQLATSHTQRQLTGPIMPQLYFRLPSELATDCGGGALVSIMHFLNFEYVIYLSTRAEVACALILNPARDK